MYIEKVPNRNSPPAILLRECWREGGKTRKRTLANLTHWPKHVVEALRLALDGESVARVEDLFTIKRSLPHGHVEAILKMMDHLGMASLVGSKRCRQRDLVLAMIAQRIMQPSSKLATTRLWQTNTLGELLQVDEVSVNEAYGALFWLLDRQKNIERKLAKRHLSEGDGVLYDVSSSYYEGRTCPLMLFGLSRDGRGDRPQVVYGVMTDLEGRPVSVSVYEGNMADPKTIPDQVEKIRQEYGLGRVLLVGDRGMLTDTQIGTLKEYPGIGWISSLRSGAIRKLVNQGSIQLSLFDDRNLAEITSAEFPGERLVVCMNPMLAAERKRKREELLVCTEKALARIAGQVARRTKKPMTESQIGLKVGRVINQKKMQKHFITKIENGLFEYKRNEDSIREEEALDGIYVVRTSESRGRLSADDAVRTYKSLAHVERAFRTLKSVQLQVRPIHHRLEETVRAHIFLCMLAYYVEWHLRKAWASILFDDEHLPLDRAMRDPVLPAESSPEAKRKKARKKTEEGYPVHSFQTLLSTLATRVKNWCGPRECPSEALTVVITERDDFQSHLFHLLEMYPVARN